MDSGDEALDMVEQNLYRYVKTVEKILPKKPIRYIFELGARDCAETLAFHKLFPDAKIYSFECNPATLPVCRNRTRNKKNITLVEKAVSDKQGTISFFPTNPALTETTWEDGNPGASSLFKASGDYPVEKYVQDEIKVKTTSLEKFMKHHKVPRIDLLWMDIQGAELMALKGASSRLTDIMTVHLEVEFMEIYSGQPLYKQLKRYLNKNNFYLYTFTNFGQYSADAVFVNSRFIRIQERPRYIVRDRILFLWYRHRPKLRSIREHFRKYKANTTNGVLGSMIKFLDRLRNAMHKTISLRIDRHPLTSVRRLIYYTWLSKAKRALCLDPNFSTIPKKSEELLDVVIPVIEKDLGALPLTLQGIRTNLAHPVGDIILVGPKKSSVRTFSKKYKCRFVDENYAAPLPLQSIHYTSNGIDRAGWLFQQLIKLNASTIVNTKRFLVIDADTVLTRPQIMTYGNRPIANHSDEFHIPYFTAYQKIIGKKPGSSMSFVSHYMLFDTTILDKLHKEIESLHKKSWWQAILDSLDYNEFSAFSEYELYGNFCLSNRVRPLRLYWFNKTLTIQNLTDFSDEDVLTNNNYKSISFHAHEKYKTT